MLKPVNKAIFVRPDKPVEKKGTLFMPPSDGRTCSGIVVASSSEMCKPGDLVFYPRFWPCSVRGEDIYVVDEKDLCGVDDSPAAFDPGAEPVAPSGADGDPDFAKILTPRHGRIIH